MTLQRKQTVVFNDRAGAINQRSMPTSQKDIPLVLQAGSVIIRTIGRVGLSPNTQESASHTVRHVNQMIHLIYISSATKEMSENDLIALLKLSRDRNKRHNITGMLLYKDGAFLQVLEGEEKDVDEIYQSICLDERNTGNYLIEREVIEKRNFPDWHMGFENLKNHNLGELDGYSEILNKELTSEEIAKCKGMAVKLILKF